jgi:putative phosphoesterase
MIIGVISDTHDHLQRINYAVEMFNRENVGAVIHCGDFVAPFSIKLFMKLDCLFYGIFGNNDGEQEGLLKMAQSFHGELKHSPHIYELSGKRILVSHSPIDPGSLSKFPAPPDYILFGHTHQPEETDVGGIPAINPGEACGWLTGKPFAGLLNLETGEYRSIRLMQ